MGTTNSAQGGGDWLPDHTHQLQGIDNAVQKVKRGRSEGRRGEGREKEGRGRGEGREKEGRGRG